jgi:hypothetical protein
MSLSTTDISNGVFVSASGADITRVKFTNAGVYNIQFSSQFSNSDNANQDTVVWLRKNGTDIPDSSGTVGVPPFKAGSNGQVIASWNYYVSLAANDFIQLCWHPEQANVITLETIAAGTSPTHPRTPSTILTATRVDTFLSNTGSFSGSFTGILTGTASYASQALSSSFATTSSYASNALSSSFSTTSSYATQALSSSFATSASYAPSIVEIMYFNTNTTNLSDATNYTFTTNTTLTTSINATLGIPLPIGTVVGWRFSTYWASLAGSSETGTLKLYWGSGPSEVTLSSAITWDGSRTAVFSGSLSQAITAVEPSWAFVTTPNFATNPQGVKMVLIIQMEI